MQAAMMVSFETVTPSFDRVAGLGDSLVGDDTPTHAIEDELDAAVVDVALTTLVAMFVFVVVAVVVRMAKSDAQSSVSMSSKSSSV
jgi:hypothetical protein